MRKTFSKSATLIMVLTILAVLCACTPKPENSGTSPETQGETVLSADAELNIVVGSHASWPYDPNKVMWKYFNEAVGGKLNINAIPNTEILTKVALMMAAPDTLPDLLHTVYKKDVDPYAMSGALIAIDDRLDDMPHYRAFWDSLPEDVSARYRQWRVSGDGKTYCPPTYGNDLVINLRTWMYRKDIFDKNGLTPPETLDDLYNVAVKLKELYPESYPISIRNGLTNIDIIGPMWKPYFTYLPYYDYASGEWRYGAAEPTMREIVDYLIKLRQADLLPRDYLTINTKSWEELVSTDRGFIMPEYIVRIDQFNTPNRTNNPEFTLAAMKAPRANTPTGQNKLSKQNMDVTGYVLCNTGKEDRIKNAVKLLDWMYSDEATELLSWGKEGETFEIIDGKRAFILSEGEVVTSKYGLRTYGLYQRIDPESSRLAYTEEQMSYIDLINESNEKEINPTLWVSLNDEEDAVMNDLGAQIRTYVEEMLSKFLLELTPMSEWDAFQAELRESGIEELLSVYQTAYDRVKQ